MHGYQIKVLVEIMYSIHKMIMEKDWKKLSKTVQLECEIDDILFELNDYPGEMTDCTIEEFFDGIRLGDFDGYTIDAMADLFFDGEQGDLSMECSFKFHGRELKKAVLHSVHVF